MIDGLTIAKEIKYLQSQLINNRIDKIYHPLEKLIIIKLKNSVDEYNRLIISVNPDFCSLHLTQETYNNPDQPSTFCMSLRKHLEGGKITAIRQLGYERLIEISIENYNEISIKTIKTLYLELMGKYSNIILAENEIIIDALYKYPIGINGFREILPKRKYNLPPLTSKAFLEELSIGALDELLRRFSPENSLALTLQKSLQGFSKKSIIDILATKGYDDLTVGEVDQELLMNLFQLLKEHTAGYHNPSKILNEEINQKFIHYMDHKLKTNTYGKLSQVLEKQIKKSEKKKLIYIDNIKSGSNADEYRVKGELLSANLYRLTSNQSEVELENYYDENRKILIKLDQRYSPAVNAKRFFKKYSKIKEGSKQSQQLLEQVNDELYYLYSIKTSLDNISNIAEYDEIRDELNELGLIKNYLGKKKKSKQTIIESIQLENGDLLFIGHNNKQNDYLTFKLAYKDDMWFHIKNAPGAHVILRKGLSGNTYSENSLLQAALAAAKASSKSSAKIQVDYTLKKYVKRHPSHRLGHAIYTDYQTIIVDSD